MMAKFWFKVKETETGKERELCIISNNGYLSAEKCLLGIQGIIPIEYLGWTDPLEDTNPKEELPSEVVVENLSFLNDKEQKEFLEKLEKYIRLHQAYNDYEIEKAEVSSFKIKVSNIKWKAVKSEEGEDK